VGGTNTRPSVLDRFVTDAELSQMMTDHFRLDFNTVEHFAIVNTHHGSNHLGDDDHVTEVSLDNSGLLHIAGLFLGTSQFLQKSHMFTFQPTTEATTDS